jgi:hypothetical protein
VCKVQDDIGILERVFELRLVHDARYLLVLSLHLFMLHLDFSLKYLKLESALVDCSSVDELVVERLPEHPLGLLAPNLLPLALRELPCLEALLEAVEQDRDNLIRAEVELLDDILALLAAVKLHDDALVDGLALTSKTRRKLECQLLLLRQATKRLSERLKQLNCTTASLYVVVVVVAFLFDTVKAFLVKVLLMSDEARVFTRPSGVRSPLIVQDGVAEFISAAACLLSFL